MVLLITYDLNNPGKDYSELYKAIKSISTIIWHQLTSVWLVQTGFSPEGVFKKLQPYIDKNDELFIVRLQKDYSGFLPQDCWNWLSARVF